MSFSPDAKLLIHVDHIWQMESIVADLAASEIHAEIFRRPKEYASFVSGIGGESYQIFVSPADYARARSVIAHLLLEAAPEVLKVIKHNYFRRVIALSLMGFLIPVLFNAAATYNFVYLLKDPEVSLRDRWIAFAVLIVFWVISLREFYWILQSVL